MTTSRATRSSPRTAGWSPRRRAWWPTRRCGTAPRSAAPLPTLTRPRTCRPSCWRWARPIARGPGGDRTIGADEFFDDYLTSTLANDEILTGVRVPKLGPGWGYRYEKFHRTAQAWAIVGVAALARRSNGQVAEARIGMANMGSTPLRAQVAEAAAAGVDASRDALRSAAQRADEGTNPPADLHGAADYRRHLARVLTARALAVASGV